MSHVDEGILHAYVDGELTDAAERREVELHLEGCETCRRALADARTLRDKATGILRDSAPVDGAAPPPFAAIQERAAKRGGRGAVRRLTRLQSWALAATVVLAVGIGSVVGLNVRRAETDAGPFEQMSAAPEDARRLTLNESEADERRADRFAEQEAPPPSPARPSATPESQAMVAGGRERKALPADEPAGAPALGRTQPTDQDRRGLASVANAAPPGAADSGTAEVRARVAAPVAAQDAVEERPAQEAVAKLTVVQAPREDVPWTAVSEGAARATLGGQLATLAGLPVTGYALRSVDGLSQVRVMHETEAGELVELIQWRTAQDSLRNGMAEFQGGEVARDSLTTVTVRHDDLTIVARGMLSNETLRRLLLRIP